MQDNEHVSGLGKVMCNLHGLEFLLRAFLSKHNETLEPSTDIGKLEVGDKVRVNS